MLPNWSTAYVAVDRVLQGLMGMPLIVLFKLFRNPGAIIVDLKNPTNEVFKQSVENLVIIFFVCEM